MLKWQFLGDLEQRDMTYRCGTCVETGDFVEAFL